MKLERELKVVVFLVAIKVLQINLVVQIFVRVVWRNTTCPLFPLSDSFWQLGICIPLDVFFYTEFSAAFSPGAMKLQEKFRMNSFGSRLGLTLAQCIVCQMGGFPFCSWQ